jgi:hypothetical protein
MLAKVFGPFTLSNESKIQATTLKLLLSFQDGIKSDESGN